MEKNAYWRKREEEQLKHYISEETEIQRIMYNKYSYMLRQIEIQINDFYARYARSQNITLAEAQRRVARFDVQAFSSKAKKYVEEKDFSPQANRELKLYNATMRINRLELLKANIGLEMIDGFNDIEKLMEQGLTKRTLDELKRQEEILRSEAGILETTVFDNAKDARAIVNASFQNATWSTRIWGNQSQLRDELSSLLTYGLIQGKNPLDLAPSLRKLFNASRVSAERLMVTEMARVQTDAQMESYKRNGFDEYVFISVDTACATCMELNGKHFLVKDMAPGENAPPIHPHCRCSTAAYVDRRTEEKELFGERIQSGGKETGGHHYPIQPNDDNRQKQAKSFYEKAIRKDDSVVIAKNTGLPVKEVRRARRHVFFDKHKLYDGRARFDADYDMAVAWNRLRKGTFLPRDLVLLQHEILESRIENKYNLTASKAHAKANEKYNWEELIDKELKGGGEPDGLL